MAEEDGDGSHQYSMESFEPFISDADSMLIFGAPVQFDTIATNDEDDFFNGERQNQAAVTENVPVKHIDENVTVSKLTRSIHSGAVKFREDSAAEKINGEMDLGQFGFLTDGEILHLDDYGAAVNTEILSADDFDAPSDMPESSLEFVGPSFALHTFPEESEDGGCIGDAPKLKKLKRRKKKKKTKPTGSQEIVAEATIQPLPTGACSARKPESPVTSKRSYSAPKPTQKAPYLPDKPGDEFKRIQVASAPQDKIKPSLVIPPLVSNLAREAKPLAAAELLKQYDVALKQIQAYRKERDILLARLDNSAIEMELEKNRTVLSEKENHISLLLDEIRSLKNQTKYQSDCLFAISRDKEYTNDETKTLASYVLVLEERVKRLKSHLETAQRRDRLTSLENERLKAKGDKVARQKNRYKTLLVQCRDRCAQLELSAYRDASTVGMLSSSVIGPGEETANLLPGYQNVMYPTGLTTRHVRVTEDDEDGDDCEDDHFNKVCNIVAHVEPRKPLSRMQTTRVQDTSLPVLDTERYGSGSPTVPHEPAEAGSFSESTLSAQNVRRGQSLYAQHTDQAEQIKKIQKSLEMQRESFIRQLSHLQSELKQSQSENINLKMHLASLEHNARTQVGCVRLFYNVSSFIPCSSRRFVEVGRQTTA
jgi:regulator of replication initiation timing